VSGGAPSQLTKLTRLHVSYVRDSRASQFQHLGFPTALQDLSIKSSNLDAERLAGIPCTGVQQHPLGLAAGSRELGTADSTSAA
jgi:hypothetical protein